LVCVLQLSQRWCCLCQEHIPALDPAAPQNDLCPFFKLENFGLYLFLRTWCGRRVADLNQTV
jgi:hypothetical protein